MSDIKPEGSRLRRNIIQRVATALTVLTVDEVVNQWSGNFFKQLHLCGINTKHFFKGVLCLQENVTNEWHPDIFIDNEYIYMKFRFSLSAQLSLQNIVITSATHKQKKKKQTKALLE